LAHEIVLVQSDHVAFELYTMSKPTIVPVVLSRHGKVSASTDAEPMEAQVTQSGFSVQGLVLGDTSL
jgi:hypothetical protein